MTDTRAGLVMVSSCGITGTAPDAAGGDGCQGGAADVFFLTGVPGGEDALVADGEQHGGEQHEGCQAREAAPAAGDVVAGWVLGCGPPRQVWRPLCLQTAMLPRTSTFPRIRASKIPGAAQTRKSAECSRPIL
jgi:hypothetical protein